MRPSIAVQVVVFLLVAGGLGYAVAKVSTGWADWIVFGVIVMCAVGGAIAINNRRFPHQGKKRTFSRDSSSRW